MHIIKVKNCLFLHILVNRKANKFYNRPILMLPLFGHILDPLIKENSKRNMLCECCIVMYVILKLSSYNVLSPSIFLDSHTMTLFYFWLFLLILLGGMIFWRTCHGKLIKDGVFTELQLWFNVLYSKWDIVSMYYCSW